MTDGVELTHPDDISAWRREHVPLFNDNKLKLGIFGQNCSNGCTMTHAPTTFEPTYEHNVKISKLADELGMELLVPVGPWRWHTEQGFYLIWSNRSDLTPEAQIVRDWVIEVA